MPLKQYGGRKRAAAIEQEESSPFAKRQRPSKEQPNEVAGEALKIADLTVKTKTLSDVSNQLSWRKSAVKVKSSTTKAKSQKKAGIFTDKKDTQLRLTLSSAPSYIHCKECGMSYVRTSPEDSDLHSKHHKRVVRGIEWPQSLKGNVVQHSADGRIIVVDGKSKGGLNSKVKEILQLVDVELSACNLSDEQLQQSKIYLYLLYEKSEIAACVVASRIESAFSVVANTHQSCNDNDDVSNSAVFCGSKPVPALVGIHRMWTAAKHRRRGFASALLDAAAMNFIYARPILTPAERAAHIAFSQPTDSGASLAKRWLGIPDSGQWKVFSD